MNQDNFIYKAYALVAGLFLATWHQIPYADGVLIVLMAIDWSAGGILASLQRRFQPRLLFDGLKRKFIVYSPLLAIRMMERLFPDSDASVDPDKWFATGLCAYELASIFQTYSAGTGRDIKPLLWILERFGMKNPEKQPDQPPQP